jgi:hypothetical protein
MASRQCSPTLHKEGTAGLLLAPIETP